MITLYGAKGSGSTVVEAALAWVDEKYRFVDIEPWDPNADLAALEKVSPLVQVPALVTSDGVVLTESVAILWWLMERHPKSKLAPPVGTAERARFQRWLVFLPAAIYPMYTVGDAVDRWVKDAAAGEELKAATVARTERCWSVMEKELAPKDYLLGSEPTILDVYVAMMTRWRPGRERLRAIAPKVVRAAERVEREPAFAKVFARNFPG